jgi:hypothetical protein
VADRSSTKYTVQLTCDWDLIDLEEKSIPITLD